MYRMIQIGIPISDFLVGFHPLEMKLNATEEILGMLNSKGRNLSDTYLIEHTFHFDEEEKCSHLWMNSHLEKCLLVR